MITYSEYAPTNIVWDKTMPSHWKCDKAKRFFSNPKELNKGNLEKNVLSLTLRGVIRNNVDNPIGLSPADYSTYQIFEANELVFKLIDLENISTSRVGIVNERGIMSSAYIRLKPITDMNLKYFYYQYYDWYKRNIFNGLGGGVRQAWYILRFSHKTSVDSIDISFGICFGWRLNRLVTVWSCFPVCFVKWTLENKYQICNSLYSSAYVGASPSNSFIFRSCFSQSKHLSSMQECLGKAIWEFYRR